MKTVEFRGKELGFKGKYVYGIGFISTTLAYDFLVTEDLKCIEVERNSVKQFVCYDKDGNAVYEEDTIIDSNGNRYVASLQPQLVGEESVVSLLEGSCSIYQFSNGTVMKGK